MSASTQTGLFWHDRCGSFVSELLYFRPALCKRVFLSFSTAQGSVDEEPDDYRRRPQVQADLRPGNLFSGDPKTR